MAGRAWQLAQVNVAVPRASLDAEPMREFVDLLAPVNALADAAPGFVWRLQTETGNATAVRVFDDERLLVNLSVWESLAALQSFVFTGEHSRVLRRRGEWFRHVRQAYTALWWVPAGVLPTVSDAEIRLEALRRNGPGPDAFTFRRWFPPPAPG